MQWDCDTDFSSTLSRHELDCTNAVLIEGTAWYKHLCPIMRNTTVTRTRCQPTDIDSLYKLGRSLMQVSVFLEKMLVDAVLGVLCILLSLG